MAEMECQCADEQNTHSRLAQLKTPEILNYICRPFALIYSFIIYSFLFFATPIHSANPRTNNTWIQAEFVIQILKYSVTGDRFKRIRMWMWAHLIASSNKKLWYVSLKTNWSQNLWSMWPHWCKSIIIILKIIMNKREKTIQKDTRDV